MINLIKKKISEPELMEMLDNILQQAMMMNGTNAGTLQIINNNDQSLEIACSAGLSDEFIEHFQKVTINDGSVCGRALHARETVFVGDITQDKSFARHLYLAMRNNINAVQSSPLISSNGRLIGVMSTHFRITRNATKIHLQKFEEFCRKASDRIEEAVLQ